MLTILVVNESTSKALTKSQRILCKYLPQVGQFTFAGSISSEGLSDLHDELKEARSKSMSVIAMQLKHDHTHTVLFIVGNKDKFDQTSGTYAFRTRTTGPQLPPFTRTPMLQLLTKITQLSALFHDLGKANLAFQTMLKTACASTSTNQKTSPSQYLRHDAVGFLVLSIYFDKLNALSPSLSTDILSPALANLHNLQNPTYQAVFAQLQQLKNHTELYALFSQQFKKLTALLTPASSPDALTLHAFLFLVLTHHRLPEPHLYVDKNTNEKTYDTAPESTYVNSNEAASWKSCITFPSSDFLAKNASITQNTTSEIIEKLSSNTPTLLDPHLFLFTLTHFSRPSLILSDHFGSKQKTDKTASPSDLKNPDLLLANTNSPQLPKPHSTPGDSLPTHLHSVFRLSRNTQNLLTSCASLPAPPSDLFPTLHVAKIRQLQNQLSLSGPPQFKWQNLAFKEIEQHPNSQFFINVIAETGAGKTIASAKLAAALNPEMRFTYCLGLRSLTLQTGQSYRTDIGLNNSQCAVLIGDSALKNHFDSTQTSGSESVSDQLDAFTYTDASDPASTPFLNYLDNPAGIKKLHELLDTKTKRMLATPILVCTIDQIISAIKLDRLSNSHGILRIFSSDLIIDEIDNFSPLQMQHICRLVSLFAFAGRNVIVMSATLPPLIAATLLSTFNTSARHGTSLFNRTKPIKAAFVSNRTPASIEILPSEITPAPTPTLPNTRPLPTDPFLLMQNHILTTLVNPYFDNFAQEQAKTPAKSSASILPFSSFDSRFHDIFHACNSLHSQHSYPISIPQPTPSAPAAIPESTLTKNVSIGFVRFNTVKNSRKFAKTLLELPTAQLPPDTEIAVLCYHSKYSNFQLSIHDHLLNTLTNRKKLSSDPDSPQLSPQAIELLTPLLSSTAATNLILIISTTSILETGRDHDYDWAIIEPNSNRSIVQAAGRVRRHRPQLNNPTRSNILLLDQPLRALDPKLSASTSSENHQFWEKPGPFDTLHQYKNNNKIKNIKALLSANLASSLLCANTPLDHPTIKFAPLPRDTSIFGSTNPFLSIYSGNLLQPLYKSSNPMLFYENYAYYDSLHLQPTLQPTQPPNQPRTPSLLAYIAPRSLPTAPWIQGPTYHEKFRETSYALNFHFLPFPPDPSSHLFPHPIDPNKKPDPHVSPTPLTPLYPHRALYLLTHLIPSATAPLKSSHISDTIRTIHSDYLTTLRKSLSESDIYSLTTYNFSFHQNEQQCEYSPLLGFDTAT